MRHGWQVPKRASIVTSWTIRLLHESWMKWKPVNIFKYAYDQMMWWENIRGFIYQIQPLRQANFDTIMRQRSSSIEFAIRMQNTSAMIVEAGPQISVGDRRKYRVISYKRGLACLHVNTLLYLPICPSINLMTTRAVGETRAGITSSKRLQVHYFISCKQVYD